MGENIADFDELIQQVETIFVEKIPFNKLLGMHVESLDFESAKVKIEMREELIGNFIQKTLHGGVTSSVLDVIGGLTAFMTLLKKMEGASSEEKLERLAKFGTIDLRVDYLRPGRGKYFIAQGSVLRTGKKIAVTRMELHNDEKVLIAVGTGTYAVV
ncbi:thioesterase family protein [candidate division KSB1 bacterium]|nr:thioesterase family protein [candidate division KSB1 bacterium]TDI80097.1 MAG: thioesterase family protein [Caldithrix sp.]TDJ03464.1 MAG: thioesterase family protein [Caldithrix sp.]